MQCLVLSYAYLPVKIIGFQRAFKMIFTNKASIVEVYEDKIFRTVSQEFHAPAVIRLNKDFDRRFKIRLTRKNIFVRDDFTCQYCGKTFSSRHNKLTIDHVVPRCKGGKHTWSNLVACCYPCNNSKGNKSLEEWGYSLKKVPQELSSMEYLRTRIVSFRLSDKWEPYVGMKKNE